MTYNTQKNILNLIVYLYLYLQGSYGAYISEGFRKVLGWVNCKVGSFWSKIRFLF